MNKDQLKNLAYGILTLKQTIGLRRLIDLSRNGIGLQHIEPSQLPKQKNVLVLAPHPDDDIFGCGGTLTHLLKNGNKVRVLFLTDGSHGTLDGHRDLDLIKLRQQEARNGLQALGSVEVTFWEAEDGTLTPSAERIKQLKALVTELEPSLLFVPWESDTHPDHQAAFLLLVKALQQVSASLPKELEIWQYEVWAPVLPNRLVPIKSVLKAKTAAIEAHVSQLKTVGYRDGILGLNTYRGAMAKFDGPAEAFFALPLKQFLEYYNELSK